MKKIKFEKLFEHPTATVDVVVFSVENGELGVLLIRRKYSPFKNMWALPGGFIRKNEELAKAARRELGEETGISGVYLEQLYTFDAPGRDPRGRVITVAYFALVQQRAMKLKASFDAKEAKLFAMRKLPKLAFDHKVIIDYALIRLRNKIQYTNAAWSMLPEAFTLGELQRLYEIILGKRLDKRNFRKKILSLGILKTLRRIKKGLRQRPARLFTFKTRKYIELRRFF